jgi:hypothetical protein
VLAVGLGGERLRVAPDHADAVAQIVAEHPLEHFETLLAALSFGQVLGLPAFDIREDGPEIALERRSITVVDPTVSVLLAMLSRGVRVASMLFYRGIQH